MLKSKNTVQPISLLSKFEFDINQHIVNISQEYPFIIMYMTEIPPDAEWYQNELLQYIQN
jgi:hypothetical protein